MPSGPFSCTPSAARGLEPKAPSCHASRNLPCIARSASRLHWHPRETTRRVVREDDMRIFLGLLMLSLMLSLGCTTNSRRGGRRGRGDGSVARDSGDDRARDDGGAARDSGVAPRDAGSTSCAEDLVPPFSGTACSTSTRSCADACSDGACISGCLDADPSPDCGGCASQNIISCFNSNGCQAEWNCFSQCATAFSCSSATVPRDCVTANCAPQDDAYNTCTDAITTGDCGTVWSNCVP